MPRPSPDHVADAANDAFDRAHDLADAMKKGKLDKTALEHLRLAAVADALSLVRTLEALEDRS